MQITLASLNARYIHSCPALYYVRNAVKKHLPKSTIELHQFTINDPYYQTLLRITEDRPEAIFFSVYVWNAAYVKRLTDDLSRLFEDVAIVLGGPEASFMESAALPSLCTIVRGEVEGLDASFYEDLIGKRLQREYTALPGKPFTMPYTDDDFRTTLKNRYIYYESSRGCPFACSYCLSSVEKRVRCRELELVKAELAQILKHSPRIIRFVDRTFNASAKRALDIWRFLIEQPGETVFHFEIAPDLFDEQMLAFLKTVPTGRFQFEIGMQSTNQATLQAVNRTMDIAAAKRNIARLVAFDTIHLHVDLILGLPHETPASYEKSVNQVFALDPHYIQLGLLKILPGTAISEQKKEFSIVSCGEPPYEILSTRWMDHETTRYLYWLGECIEAFYNNRFFREFFRYIRKVEQNPFAFFEELLTVCTKNNFFELSPTQELMSKMLSILAEKRPDRELLHGLLRYDWLRCGHKYLPAHLLTEPINKARDLLWQQLPQNYPPLFSHTTRSEFFKRSTFLKVPGAVLRETGFSEELQEGYVCFLPEQTGGVFKFCKTAVIPAEIAHR